MLFSEYFKISKTGEEGWFDPVLGVDVPLFLDPYLIENSGIGEFEGVRNKIKEFFQNVFEKIIKARSENRPKEAMNVLKEVLVFPEVAELCLGYSKNTRGSGSGRKFANEIYQAIIDYLYEIGMDKEDFSHVEILSFFSEGIAHDRISDITANIIKEDIIKYTQEICRKYHIPTRRLAIDNYRFNEEQGAWIGGYFDLPFNEFNKKPILLVPKVFLRQAPTFDYSDFTTYLITNSSESLRKRFSVSIAQKLDKRKLKEIIREKPYFLHNYLQEKYGVGKIKLDPYNLDDDKNFIYYKHIIPSKLFEKFPKLNIKINNEDDLLRIIRDMALHFKYLIEKQEGYRLLWKVREEYGHFPEWVINLLFKMVVYKQCEDNNIDLSIESQAGNGKVEFKFSQGYAARILLETKLTDNPNFTRGLQKQLPEYMNAEKITRGIFLAVYFKEEDKEKVEKLKEKVKKLNLKQNSNIEIVEIDASKRLPPSRLR